MLQQYFPRLIIFGCNTRTVRLLILILFFSDLLLFPILSITIIGFRCRVNRHSSVLCVRIILVYSTIISPCCAVKTTILQCTRLNGARPSRFDVLPVRYQSSLYRIKLVPSQPAVVFEKKKKNYQVKVL